MLYVGRCISRNEREQIVRAKTGRAPCKHCRFRELKFSIRKYVIVVLANETTAEEVEETGIPGISVDRNGYSRGCNRGCNPWISSLTIVIQWQALENRTVRRASRFFYAKHRI